MKTTYRVYVDTSVWGGVFDNEFSKITRRFFNEVREGRYSLILSEITARELKGAPQKVRQFVADFPEKCYEVLTFTDEMAELRDAYIKAGVLEPKWIDDAAHVAVATVARSDLIISWNFRHLVKWEKIRAFNAVNLSLGYPIMTIMSPREVIRDEQGL